FRRGKGPMMRSVRKWTAIGIVSAALLGGCAIGPNYQRPAVAEPQTFRGQATAEAASLADAPWWEVFQDPILKTLIQEALRNNYDVRIAAARVQEARANFRVSRSDLYPSLDYSAGVARAKISPGITGVPGGPVANASNFYYGALTASWEVDIWGRIRRSNEAAWATFLATEDARRGVWLTLVSDLAQAYFELLELDVRLDIARNSTGAYQRTFNVFQDRFQFGTASRLETARAEGALGEAQATIPQLESDIVAKENQIGILLGKTPAPIPRGTPMYAQAVVPTVPAGLPSTLIARREVSDALTALGKLSEAETGQDRAVKALEQAVEHATDRYRFGLASYFEVLEAQQQLYPAQYTLAQIRRDRLLSHVRLYKALGGGWSLTDAQWKDGAP